MGATILRGVIPNSELITLNSEATASAGPRSSMVELLICNQRVGGSNPSVGSKFINVLIIKITFPPLFSHY